MAKAQTKRKPRTNHVLEKPAPTDSAKGPLKRDTMPAVASDNGADVGQVKNGNFMVKGEQLTATVEMPLAPPLAANESRRTRIDTTLIGTHGAMFERIRRGLDQSNARLQDGKPVHTCVDALKWIAENLS